MSKQQTEFPLERVSEIQSRTTDFKLLERIPLTLGGVTWPLKLSDPMGDEKKMVLLDVETTGLNIQEEVITELGMVVVSYSPSAGKISTIDGVISLYDDPGKPIPEEITQLTGITNAMVKGQKIDVGIVTQWLQNASLIVAHNAWFDRQMFEKRFPEQSTYPWACSFKGVDWKSLGFKSLALDYLLLRLGWFYEGHRASIDCLAMAWLFHLLPQAFESLLVEADKRTIRVQAMGAPFAVKDTLRERKYRWHNGDKGPVKHWWRDVSEEDLEDEKCFLDGLYQQGSLRAQYVYLDACNRFKGN
jgi:DNA polymerase-3 subunit epsilon